MMFETITPRIQFNVKRADAEELYDETEDHLALCFESVLENAPKYKDTSNLLERILSPAALTGFLCQKLGNDLIKIESIFIDRSMDSLEIFIYLKITAPNIWAIKYGKDLEERLEDAVNFLKNPRDKCKIKIPLQSPVPCTGLTDFSEMTFNGKPVTPLIGSIYHDQLTNLMKYWDGKQWLDPTQGCATI